MEQNSLGILKTKSVFFVGIDKSCKLTVLPLMFIGLYIRISWNSTNLQQKYILLSGNLRETPYQSIKEDYFNEIEVYKLR
jgi:hypothetical protein